MRGFNRDALFVSSAVVCAAVATPAMAQTKSFDVPAQAAESAIREFGRQADIQIIAARKITRGKRTNAVRGDMTVTEGLSVLLQDTGLDVRRTGPQTFTVVSATHASVDDRPLPPTTLAEAQTEIVVTGSRIQGAPTASQVVTVTKAEMENAGQHSLSDVVRSIPQNFGGGQNPGVGFNVPQSSGENIGGGTSINLRGLGQDATLTLLNGQRLTYGGYRQSVDVGAIPFLAVDRIEIVPDGASAIYGSDAVAGVANIILKPDYEGLQTFAQMGWATQGGYHEQQYGALGGSQWSTGGFLAAYEFGRSTAVEASQRPYSAVPNKGLTLFPFLKHHSALVSGHQDITGTLSGKIDAVYNWRTDQRSYSISAADDSPSYDIRSRSWMLAITPSLQWKPSEEWTVNLVGSYGVDKTRYGFDLTAGGVTAPALRACYCNESWSAEANAQGTILDLPAGPASLAFGGGFRKNSFHAYRTVGSAQDIEESQSSYFGYGELNVPLVASDQDIPLVHHASFSGAVRYEKYLDVDSVATPKLGLIYAPIRDLELKATWGKSFKAPTLFQRYNDQGVLVYTAASRGGTGYPSTATALFLYGGQPDLKPERANTWSATATFSPQKIPGLLIEASYFHIDFKDRVLAPISVTAQSLSNTAYSSLITLNPTEVQIAEALAGRSFANLVPGTFDPSQIVAIIDNRNRNVASQRIEGVDLNIQYKFAVGNKDSLTLSAYGSYIDSEQTVLSGNETIQLAGTYFNPPHFRGRGGIVWERDLLSLAAFVNYVEGSTDTRYAPYEHIHGQATVDLAFQYELGDDAGVLKGLKLSLSVTNLLDQDPPQSQSNYIQEPTYDTTNFSPIGRVIGIGLTKAW